LTSLRAYYANLIKIMAASDGQRHIHNEEDSQPYFVYTCEKR